ncbi:interferon-related developmental regulator 2-like [Lolium rigidum]|uniref:interferon-related developmental regulator 2-like n=1 Tax=Lolium rigidum TaxID=89674 RepID=UPI001F5D5D53|nr:interferon-related developmental regulator 2-like [Lolium rigidum]
MGKSKKSKARGGAAGDDLLDSSDADSVETSSTALSDLSISYATENVNSHEFVLDKYIDALYEKRGSTREAALASLVDAFESFMLDGLVENKYATLLSLFNTSIKKGSTKEACLASRAIGLLSITLGAGSTSHETMVESHPQLSKVLQTWSDASKMISALDCLAVVTFVGATDLAETELSLKAMWDVIHPKSGSNVGTVRKPKPPVLAAALSSWTFLLTTIGSWRINTDSWKEPIAFLSTLLGAEDRAVRMAAGEALALCFELKLLDVSACEDDDDDTGVAGTSKSKLFLDMQALKAKIAGLASNLSAEAGGKGADKKNLSDQRDLFQRILDFVKYGECPEESLKIAGKRDVLRVSSWSELIQLNFFKHFLGRGFLKHVQDNGLLQDIFSIRTDKAESLSSSDKKIFRSGEEKGRALKLNKDRRQAQERKNAALFNE